MAGTPQAITLHCPACGYNLTGLTRNVCPECGGAFDPTNLEQPPQLRHSPSNVPLRMLIPPGIAMAMPALVGLTPFDLGLPVFVILALGVIALSVVLPISVVTPGRGWLRAPARAREYAIITGLFVIEVVMSAVAFWIGVIAASLLGVVNIC